MVSICIEFTRNIATTAGTSVIYGHFLDNMDETASDTLERIFKNA